MGVKMLESGSHRAGVDVIVESEWSLAIGVEINFRYKTVVLNTKLSIDLREFEEGFYRDIRAILVDLDRFLE